MSAASEPYHRFSEGYPLLQRHIAEHLVLKTLVSACLFDDCHPLAVARRNLFQEASPARGPPGSTRAPSSVTSARPTTAQLPRAPSEAQEHLALLPA